jgi:hypothetical protein
MAKGPGLHIPAREERRLKNGLVYVLRKKLSHKTAVSVA